MSDAKGIDDEDVPEDKKAELVEGSGQQSMEEVDEREQIQKEEGISKILSSDDFVSKPFFRKEFTVPEDILVFQYPLFAVLGILMASEKRCIIGG